MKQSPKVDQQKSFVNLIRRYPIASIFGLWVLLLMLAGLSTAMLVNVNNAAQTKIAQPPTEPTTNEALLTQPSRGEFEGQMLPLLSLGAIALSCTLGCLFLSRTLRSTGYQPVQRKTFKVENASLSQAVEPETPDPFDTKSPDAASVRSTPSSETSVTVVPKQQNHPLDWDEPSLADSLDLRQRRPLSHWL